MTNPAAIILTGVVIAAAAIFAIFAATSSTQKTTGYGRQRQDTRFRPPSPPPSPPPPPSSSARRRRRSPERRSNFPICVPATADEQPKACKNCGNSPYIKVYPCSHELCKECFTTNLENNDTCPDCQGRIDSCTPPIPSFGKCGSCRQFTKLFKFLPCNHSLSLCISCFEEQKLSYEECPECKQKIQESEPSYTTSGVCYICDEFTQFGSFQPCGHGNLCRTHALEYLASGGEECSVCGSHVTEVVAMQRTDAIRN